MNNLILFWHRRDLRISDNIGLAAANEKSNKVVGVFCLDPNILESEDIAPPRVTYMIGCLQELQQNYLQAGSQLIILKGEPSQEIPKLATALNVKGVFWNLDVEPYARERDRKFTQVLKEQGIPIQTFWDQLLHSPQEIASGANQPYTVYTPFWKNWVSKPKNEPAARFKNRETLTDEEKEVIIKAGAIILPTAKDLGFVWNNELMLTPGETAAQERLEEFCTEALFSYKEKRNFPAIDGTSRLSAALKFGAIGIRTVWDAIIEAIAGSSSDEAQESVKTWQQELAWREFYQHAMYHFPELAEGAYRQIFKTFPYDNNVEHFQAWCEGKTGYPIVDAAMRQLNSTAWMHNRCRMIVASFLTKDLLIDPKMGEKYFTQNLYDWDLSANNGGWQWSASSGMDPKPVRIFNPASQAQKFDPNGEYIRKWLPELRSLPTKLLISGEIPDSQREKLGYPLPIVEHKIQQRVFKERYSQQKLE
jgi:deoxyribodipyrimidine photo-lyase